MYGGHRVIIFGRVDVRCIDRRRDMSVMGSVDDVSAFGLNSWYWLNVPEEVGCREGADCDHKH